jgi:hypothetical protein
MDEIIKAQLDTEFSIALNTNDTDLMKSWLNNAVNGLENPDEYLIEKSKYIRREGVKGNYKYIYNEKKSTKHGDGGNFKPKVGDRVKYKGASLGATVNSLHDENAAIPGANVTWDDGKRGNVALHHLEPHIEGAKKEQGAPKEESKTKEQLIKEYDDLKENYYDLIDLSNSYAHTGEKEKAEKSAQDANKIMSQMNAMESKYKISDFYNK